MKIINVEISDFDDATIRVEADSGPKKEVFYVQTVGDEYRSDLGCWVTTDYSDGDINEDDYPEFDISEIIDAAENFLSSSINCLLWSNQQKRKANC